MSSPEHRGIDKAIIACLLLSCCIWLLYSLSLQYSEIVSVRVAATSNIEGRTAASSDVATVTARCRTTGFRLARLSSQFRHEKVRMVDFLPSDLHLTEGDTFSIDANELASYAGEIFGDGVRLEAFISKDAHFTFSRENCRKLPVNLVCSLSYRQQCTAASPVTLEPDSVYVYGEDALLQNIESVPTRPLALSNLASPVHGVIRLEGIEGLRLSETEVNYSLDVVRYVEVSGTFKVGLTGVPSDRTLSVYPSAVDIVFRCAFPVKTDPRDRVSVTLDYSEVASSKGGRCIPVVKGLPKGVIDYHMDPEVLECIEMNKR